VFILFFIPGNVRARGGGGDKKKKKQQQTLTGCKIVMFCCFGVFLSGRRFQKRLFFFGPNAPTWGRVFLFFLSARPRGGGFFLFSLRFPERKKKGGLTGAPAVWGKKKQKNRGGVSF